MLGIEDYGSGSDSDSEGSSQRVQPKKTSLSLPPPKAPAKKKVAIGLPTLKPVQDDDDDDLQAERPAAKKPRLGAGASSLLSMLPAPKQKAPVLPAPERVLGSGKGPGLVFNAPRLVSSSVSEDIEEEIQPKMSGYETDSYTVEEEPTTSSTAFAFRPPSLAKGKANISLEEPKARAPPRTALKSSAPSVDFFSLGSVSSSSTSTSALPASTSSSVSISSAPVIPTFEVPEPSTSDPYPGYYQLPSGEWRQHDLEYYETFRKKWEREYNAHVRALEKGAVKGFEGYEQGDVADVNAAQEMERAKLEIKEREERKAVSKIAEGAPAKPKMNITAAKLSGRARSRHQLATLLNEAYENREALEDKIAEGRRNRKEAGNKYGF